MTAVAAKNGTSGSDSAALEAVLSSTTFERSPKLRDLLRFLWEHRSEEITEYAIATQALGRPNSFDPHTDASTRVTIARLRQKLDDYYAGAGHAESRRIVLPTGSYRPFVEERELAVAKFDGLRCDLRRWRSIALVTGGLAAVLALVCALVLVAGSSSRGASSAAPALPAFWQTFARNGKPVVIALPTPVFHWFNEPRMVVRDPAVNDYGTSSASPKLAELRKQWGPSIVTENFAVLADVEAAWRLLSFLQARGVAVSILATDELSPAKMEASNVILLGLPGTSKLLDDLMKQLNFGIRLGVEGVFSREPRVGEARFFDRVTQSPEHQVLPGIVALVPDSATGSNVLILAGRATNSAAMLLTLSHGLDSVEEMRRKQSSSANFEIVFKTELSGRNVLRTWPVACRPVRSLVPAR